MQITEVYYIDYSNEGSPRSMYIDGSIECLSIDEHDVRHNSLSAFGS